MLWPALAQSQDFIEYEVKRGDTCIKIAKKVYGDGDLCYELMAGSNEFDEKFRIYPGQKLKLPTKEQIAQQRAAKEGKALPAKTSGPDARLKAFRGEVTARSPDAEGWEDASRNKDLWRRWKVNSADSSSASVLFIREKATLRMRENTLVVIYGKGASKSAPSTSRHAVLEKGALSTRLGELSGGSSPAASLEIETPSAIVNSEGGDALVSVVAGDTTLVANHTSTSTKVRGKRKKSKSVALPKNTGSKVEKGKDPTPPRPLPSSPKWDKPAFSAVSMAGKSRVRVSWDTVKDAVVWRVEVWRKTEKELMDVAVLDAKLRELVFEDFEPGDYELRIATIDSDGFESIMSDPVPLSVKELLATNDLPDATRSRQASGRLFLGEQLNVADGLDCAFAGRRVSSQTVSTNKTGTYRLVCMDNQGNALPAQDFVVSPNAATLVGEPSGTLQVGAVEEIRLVLEHPIREIDVFVTEGFTLHEPARLEEGGVWVIPVRATKADRKGEMRLGTPGIMGATLAKVPLQSGAVEVVDLADSEPEKAWRIQLGALASSHDVLGDTAIKASGADYTQGLRFGINTGVQWQGRAVLDLQFDTGSLISSMDTSNRTQVFGIASALSYRFGPWAIKPYLRAGGGVDFMPDLGTNMGRVFGGGGLVWTIERRVDLRLDVHQNLLFDESDSSPGVMMPGATFGFAGTF